MKGFDFGFLRKHAAISVWVAMATGAVGGCSGHTDYEPIEFFVDLYATNSVGKVDIVLGIDNSRSMADKQQILAAAVPDLVRGLVNPRCIDNSIPPIEATMQPMNPTDPCPAGFKREFDPILDIHIGIVTSSIGGHGADSCPDADTSTQDCGATPNFTNNDRGHLISRADPCGGTYVPTYVDQGFLAWDPTGKLVPPGEAVVTNLNTNLTHMVIGTGQIGCGYESQLESWYRFLVDPEPFESISVIAGYATPSPEIDLPLISQRAQFLRPDSLLAIIMLTDENDCSIKESGQNFYAGQLSDGSPDGFQLPKARAVCETDPNNECCYSCGQTNIPANCGADPTCMDGNGNTVYLTKDQDAVTLRCWEQKRRFGIDFLYPIDRYVQALTKVQIPNRAGQLVPNPIFSDLNPNDELRNIRDPGRVFLAGIVGVPWQDIARDPNDLTKGFKDADELAIADPNLGNRNVWDIILGDPVNDVDALDPLMVESVAPRSGVNPITNDALQPPGSPTPNPINGTEWTISGNNDLQYACIFPLNTPRDCAMPGQTACDCETPGDNPLCNGTEQVRAKGYPGLRELAVLRGMTSQGIVASVCPAQTSNPAGLDYGYRPAAGAILSRLKDAFSTECLPRLATANTKPGPEFGTVPCLILEAYNSGGDACDCSGPARQKAVGTEQELAIGTVLRDPLAKVHGWNCFCEITQTTGGDLTGCQNDPGDPPLNPVTMQNIDGWCYVDATTSPPIGNPDLVADCPATERRTIRFAGEGHVKAGRTLFIACFGE